MPLYDFCHISTKEVREVFLRMNDPKVYLGEDGTEEGQWKRIYTSPNAFVGSSNKINPFSANDFVKFTGEKKGTYGQMMELSSELSAKRAAKEGTDPVKNKWLSDYKKTNGVEHFDSKKDKVIKKNGVTIDFGAK